jgi:hypothetical protein
VISLAGGISITASEGETRHIGAGEIVLVEDTTGKGHNLHGRDQSAGVDPEPTFMTSPVEGRVA